MIVLRQALDDYLRVRRALGYKLARSEKLLAQFLTFVEDRNEDGSSLFRVGDRGIRLWN
jgi:hypothetical protein